MGSTEFGVFDARFIASLSLPISAVAFALISLFPLVRRWLGRQPIAFSWVGVARAVGCFAGLWAGGLAVWLFASGEELYAVSVLSLLGLLLTIPWRVITKAWLW